MSDRKDPLAWGPYQCCYNDKRVWLENRFQAIVDEIRRTGMLGVPIDELCEEAAEVACWLILAQRTDDDKQLRE